MANKVSARQIKRELKHLDARTSPIFCEHFDAWFVVGLRAGGTQMIALEQASSAANTFAVESYILLMAEEIMKRRLAPPAPDGET